MTPAARSPPARRKHFAEADRIMATCPRRAVRAPRLMEAAYRQILTRLLARGWAPPRTPREDQQASPRRRAAPPRDRLMAGTVHVIGAGLSGLSAAVELAARRPSAWSSTRRRNSPADAAAPTTIPSSTWRSTTATTCSSPATGRRWNYLRRIGGLAAMTEASEAAFPFADLKTGERWTLRPNAGRLPWWILDSRRRVPGTRAPDYLAPLGVLRAPADATVGDVMPCSGPLYERLWRPVLLAALNTEPAEADARLAAQILRETLAAGGQACRPMVATGGLSAAFIDPALALSRERGGEVRLSHSLREIIFSGDRAIRLDFGDEKIAIGPDDSVVLAVPPVVARALVPGLDGAGDFSRHRQRAFPHRAAEKPAAHPRRNQRHDGVAFRLSRPAFDHDQLRRPADGGAAPAACRGDLARGRGPDRPCSGAAPLADRARTPGDLRGNAGGSGAPAGARDALLKSGPRRRLDGHRASGDDRGIDPLGADGGSERCRACPAKTGASRRAA